MSFCGPEMAQRGKCLFCVVVMLTERTTSPDIHGRRSFCLWSYAPYPDFFHLLKPHSCIHHLLHLLTFYYFIFPSSSFHMIASITFFIHLQNPNRFEITSFVCFIYFGCRLKYESLATRDIKGQKKLLIVIFYNSINYLTVYNYQST